MRVYKNVSFYRNSHIIELQNTYVKRLTYQQSKLPCLFGNAYMCIYIIYMYIHYMHIKDMQNNKMATQIATSWLYIEHYQ